MANQGSTHKILQRTGESRSFESYESLHKYCSHYGSKHYREFTANILVGATDGAGTAKAVASSTAVTEKGKTELTLVAASDVHDDALNNAIITVYYYTSAGVKYTATATLTSGATDTEVAFTKTVAGTAVTDFYCFNQDDHGPVVGAVTYGSAVVSSAVSAARNICVGITGLVAGIADPELCYAHINATKYYPLLADIYGQGQIWGEREADTAGDDTAVTTLEYITPWGEVKTATCTNTTTHSDIIRYIDADTTQVGDYYRTRTLTISFAPTKAHHVCDHDGATHYAVIEAAANCSCHVTYTALASAIECHIGEIHAGWSSLTGLCTLKLTYTPFGTSLEQTRTWQFYHDQVIKINERLAALTDVAMTVADDTGDAGIANVDVCYIEAGV